MSDDDCITISSSDDDIQIMDDDVLNEKEEPKLELNRLQKKRIIPIKVESSEEIFSHFIEECRRAKPDDEDIDKGIEKIQKRFNDAEKKYTSSILFKQLIDSALSLLMKEPWTQMKRVADELKNNKAVDTKCIPAEEENAKSSAPLLDRKTQRNIKNLEKTLQKLNAVIEELEENELDFNDLNDENSSYIKVSRYKEKFKQVHKKLCELRKKEEEPTEVEKPLRLTSNTLPIIDRAIEKFYNCCKKFPDYRDILKLVESVNKRKELNLSQNHIVELAETAFTELGNTLKRRRHYELFNHFGSYIKETGVISPPSDDQLDAKLNENYEIFRRKLDDIIDEHAKKQNEYKNEPTEVPDDAPSSDEDNKDDEGEVEDEQACVTSASDYETDNEQAEKDPKPNEAPDSCDDEELQKDSASEESESDKAAIHSTGSKPEKIQSLEMEVGKANPDPEEYQLMDVNVIKEYSKTEESRLSEATIIKQDSKAKEISSSEISNSELNLRQMCEVEKVVNFNDNSEVLEAEIFPKDSKSSDLSQPCQPKTSEKDSEPNDASKIIETAKDSKPNDDLKICEVKEVISLDDVHKVLETEILQEDSEPNDVSRIIEDSEPSVVSKIIKTAQNSKPNDDLKMCEVENGSNLDDASEVLEVEILQKDSESNYVANPSKPKDSEKDPKLSQIDEIPESDIIVGTSDESLSSDVEMVTESKLQDPEPQQKLQPCKVVLPILIELLPLDGIKLTKEARRIMMVPDGPCTEKKKISKLSHKEDEKASKSSDENDSKILKSPNNDFKRIKLLHKDSKSLKSHRAEDFNNLKLSRKENKKILLSTYKEDKNFLMSPIKEDKVLKSGTNLSYSPIHVDDPCCSKSLNKFVIPKIKKRVHEKDEEKVTPKKCKSSIESNMNFEDNLVVHPSSVADEKPKAKEESPIFLKHRASDNSRSSFSKFRNDSPKYNQPEEQFVKNRENFNRNNSKVWKNSPFKSPDQDLDNQIIDEERKDRFRERDEKCRRDMEDYRKRRDERRKHEGRCEKRKIGEQAADRNSETKETETKFREKSNDLRSDVNRLPSVDRDDLDVIFIDEIRKDKPVTSADKKLMKMIKKKWDVVLDGCRKDEFKARAEDALRNKENMNTKNVAVNRVEHEPSTAFQDSIEKLYEESVMKEIFSTDLSSNDNCVINKPNHQNYANPTNKQNSELSSSVDSSRKELNSSLIVNTSFLESKSNLTANKSESASKSASDHSSNSKPNDCISQEKNETREEIQKIGSHKSAEDCAIVLDSPVKNTPSRSRQDNEIIVLDSNDNLATENSEKSSKSLSDVDVMQAFIKNINFDTAKLAEFAPPAPRISAIPPPAPRISGSFAPKYSSTPAPTSRHKQSIVAASSTASNYYKTTMNAISNLSNNHMRFPSPTRSLVFSSTTSVQPVNRFTSPSNHHQRTPIVNINRNPRMSHSQIHVQGHSMKQRTQTSQLFSFSQPNGIITQRRTMIIEESCARITNSSAASSSRSNIQGAAARESSFIPNLFERTNHANNMRTTYRSSSVSRQINRFRVQVQNRLNNHQSDDIITLD